MTQSDLEKLYRQRRLQAALAADRRELDEQSAPLQQQIREAAERMLQRAMMDDKGKPRR